MDATIHKLKWFIFSLQYEFWNNRKIWFDNCDKTLVHHIWIVKMRWKLQVLQHKVILVGVLLCVFVLYSS